MHTMDGIGARRRARVLSLCMAAQLLALTGCTSGGSDASPEEEMEEGTQGVARRSWWYTGARDCGVDASGADAGAAPSDASSPDAATLDAGAPTAPGVALEAVTANGTGCRAGTWSVDISSDRASFVMRLSELEAEVADGAAVDVADCSLALKVRAPSQQSFALASITYRGTAQLGTGVSGLQSTSAYFQGNPADASERERVLRGPYDDAFTITDQIAEADRKWSPCGVERDLNVVVRLRVKRDGTAGEGAMGIDQISDVRLVSRKCP